MWAGDNSGTARHRLDWADAKRVYATTPYACMQIKNKKRKTKNVENNGISIAAALLFLTTGRALVRVTEIAAAQQPSAIFKVKRFFLFLLPYSLRWGFSSEPSETSGWSGMVFLG